MAWWIEVLWMFWGGLRSSYHILRISLIQDQGWDDVGLDLFPYTQGTAGVASHHWVHLRVTWRPCKTWVCDHFQDHLLGVSRVPYCPCFFLVGGHTKSLKIRHRDTTQRKLGYDLAHPGCQDGGDSFFFSFLWDCWSRGLGILGNDSWPGTLMPSANMVLTKPWSRCSVQLQLLKTALFFFLRVVWFIYLAQKKPRRKNKGINLEELGDSHICQRTFFEDPSKRWGLPSSHTLRIFFPYSSRVAYGSPPS